MEANTLQKREDFLRKFEDAKQRKHEMVEKMKEEMTIECEKRNGKKPTSFFVLWKILILTVSIKPRHTKFFVRSGTILQEAYQKQNYSSAFFPFILIYIFL